ncbi:MAG: stage IV sporulation protein A [Oscillospiraceae bacterium]|jgi:stage IV sporulation protein A|nr:stage IV sporulation protein A [Oscillospiraceae bacterium]
MEENNIYADIANRTSREVYCGVVGPVRTGKSTFIKKFMDALVIPNIKDKQQRERTIDELPQSAGGKTIMTTEPKFVPEDAVEINIDGKASFKARVIDCVGYIVPSALGYIENETPRMVMTPWFKEEIPFTKAAEIGTKKVINEHSTIGLVITTDGSISDIDRSEYEDAEQRVIRELQEINKPFLTLLNSIDPNSKETQDLSKRLEEKYSVPVMPVNCMELTEKEIKEILAKILYEFSITEVKINMPKWVSTLEKDHWLKSEIYNSIKNSSQKASKIREAQTIAQNLCASNYVINSEISSIDLGTGSARVNASLDSSLFYRVLQEKTGIDIKNECELMQQLLTLTKLKDKYERIGVAYDDVSDTGYGIVVPKIEELILEEPEIVKQGGKYGVRLRASAPVIHMLCTKVTAEVTPIVGSEQQSEDLIMYLLKDFEENPTKIWESNIFGKSLHELVNEGLQNKLYRMPADAREKLKQTIERIINEGCNGLICIIL